MSQSFFKNPFTTSKSFKFECRNSQNNNVIEFCVNTNLQTHMKQSISSFIKEFISTTNQFLQFDLEEIIKLDYISFTHLDDFQLFFCTDKENKVYIESILNNLDDLINVLSISNTKPNLTNFINEEIVHLTYSILIARFNNKVEIEPIIELIPKFQNMKFGQRDWENPSNKEFMALCSAIQFTLCPTDRLRKRFYSRSSIMRNKKEEEEMEEEEETIGNYHLEFGGDNNNNKPPLIREQIYKTLVDEALNISATEIYNLSEKYNIRYKKWTEIIWSIFYDFFNKKLNEINLNFDTNNKYLQGFSGIDCLRIENSVIINYFPQLNNVKDLCEKDIWIGRFICIHKEYELEIKSAYLYAIMSSYAFLKIFYTFDIE